MTSIPQAYDALPSEIASTSPTLCQSDNEPNYEKAKSSTVSSTPNAPIRSYISRCWTNWEWEFAACFLVLVFPIITFATVYPHNGQPLPQWPFNISINSLLSVYTLVFKAAIGFILTSCIGQLQWTWFSETRPLTDVLRFDNATRGAPGALGLIWRQRFRRPLTVLGCAITVLAVAVDPFIQQLVQPIDCSVEMLDDNMTATLPRTNRFEGYGYDEDSEIMANDLIQHRTGTNLKGVENALYSGVFSPGQAPPWKCSTGNCTFADTYGTIGICHSCQDASSNVIINVTCWEPDSSYASHYPTSGADCPADSLFTIDSNLTVNEDIKLGTNVSFNIGEGFDLSFVADANYHLKDNGIRNSLSFGFLAGAIANDTAPARSMCNSSADYQPWRCRQGYGAATCSLHPCVQIYEATISAGVLEENLVASSSDMGWGVIQDDGTPLYLAMIDTQCPAQNLTSRDKSSTTESRWLPYNINVAALDTGTGNMSDGFWLPLPSDVISLLTSGCLYVMSTDSIMSFVSDYLRGTIRTGSNLMTDNDDGLRVAFPTGFTGPEVIRYIFNWGHSDFERVQSVFANISYSLTTYIRTHGSRTKIMNWSRDAQGKSYHYATCLQVRWPWIAFPVSLAVLTTVFLLAVVETTGRQGTLVWKASPLAWILRAEGLDNEQFLSSTRTCEGMKERSGQVAVHLLDEDVDEPRILMADIKDPNLG